VFIINSIERVKTALNFEGPDKVPIWKAFGGESDVFTMFRMPSKQWQPGHIENEKSLFPYVGDDSIIKAKLWTWERPDWAQLPKFDRWLDIIPREEIDEWGTIWKRAGVDTMGHPSRPSLPDYTKLDDYIEKYTPLYEDKNSYSFFIKLSKTMGKDKYRMCSLNLGPFQMAANMRGFSELLIDHRRKKQELKNLLEFITNQFIIFENMWVKYNADPHGFILYDDLGEQKGPIFSLKMFKEYWEPVYRPLFETAHDLGCHFHLHCCGKIDPIIPLLIEWGLDALELDSPRMTGYPDLNQFRGKIMMWGCINIQSIYPNGTPEEIEREVWHMIRNLGTPKGGFGAYFYPQENHIRVSKEKVKAFSKGLTKYGNYSKIPDHWWTYPIPVDWKDNEVPPLPPMIG
jgi:hypothetical protein